MQLVGHCLPLCSKLFKGCINLQKLRLQLLSPSPKVDTLLMICLCRYGCLQKCPLIFDRIVFSPHGLVAPRQRLAHLICGITDGRIAIDHANLGNLILVFPHILPIPYKDLHGGEERLLALKENTAAMLSQRIIAETEGEGGGHKL